jgi:hypothetical protein
MRPFTLLPVGVLLLSTAAFGQTIYTWVGADGVEHFTDDRSTAPKGARLRTTEGEVISSLQMQAPKSAPGAGADAGVGVAPAAPVDPSAAADELTWRTLFRDARERVASLEDAVEADRKQVEGDSGAPMTGQYLCSPSVTGVGLAGRGQVGGLTVVAPVGVSFSPCVYVPNPQFEQLRQRLALNRKALERAKADLSDLERRAAFVGVPNEWRR